MSCPRKFEMLPTFLDGSKILTSVHTMLGQFENAGTFSSVHPKPFQVVAVLVPF